MSEIGLNIQEAHAFCTIDGYSLDVFVVDGWEKVISVIQPTISISYGKSFTSYFLSFLIQSHFGIVTLEFPVFIIDIITVS